MRMRKAISIVAAVAACLMATHAHAQLGGLAGKMLGLPAKGVASGAYQSKNQIRTYISADPYDPIDIYAKAIIKAAEMTQAKGFARFGVTKARCSTLLMNNIPRAKSCYVIAIMLNDGEEAKARGKLKVVNYTVADVLAGVIVRPGS